MFDVFNMFKEQPWLILSLVSPDVSASRPWYTRQQMLWGCHPQRRRPLQLEIQPTMLQRSRHDVATEQQPIQSDCSRVWSPVCKFSKSKTNSGKMYLAPGFPGGSEVKASACNAVDLGPIPGSGRSPGEGNGNPFQYSCLENPMDGGAWWATVHSVAKSRTRLSHFTLHIGKILF